MGLLLPPSLRGRAGVGLLLKMFPCPIQFPAVFLVFQRVTLVVLFLTFSQRYVHLGEALLVQIHAQGDDGEAILMASVLLQRAYLLLVQQQLTVAARLVVVVRAIEIGRNVHALHPNLAVVNVAERIYQRCLTQTDGLYLRARKHHARRVGVNDKVVKLRPLVLYYNALLGLILIVICHNF